MAVSLHGWFSIMLNFELKREGVFSHDPIDKDRWQSCEGLNGFSGSGHSSYMVLRLLVYSIYRSCRCTIQVKSALIESDIPGLFDRVKFWINLNSSLAFSHNSFGVRKNHFLNLTRISSQEENILTQTRYILDSNETNYRLLNHQFGGSGGITHYE